MKQLADITHPELVAALAKPGQDIIDSLTPQKAHLWHMASCLPGEVAEVVEGQLMTGDEANLLEELGDCAFYLEGIWQGIDMTPPSYTPRHHQSFSRLTYDLVIAAGQVFDAVKKDVIYNKSLNYTDLTIALHKFGQAAVDLAHFGGFTWQEVTAANIAKLSKRYVGLTYSDKSAQERADKSPECKWNRVRDLPENEHGPFWEWLLGQTRPMIPGVPDSEQDAFYLHDYEAWKAGLPALD